MVGPPVTVAVVAPAVPLTETSLLENPVIVSVNTTVKLIREALVGSAWAAAWLIVTVGAVLSTMKVVLGAEAGARLPARSLAVLEAMEIPKVPSPVMLLMVTVRVVPEPASTQRSHLPYRSYSM